jgi:hypothetical protein
MTISSTNRKAGPYTGAGSTGPYSFAFKVFQASDLLVVKVNTTTTIETTLTLTTDYTVSLNADQNSNPGGSITLTNALASGYNMVISSTVPLLQTTDLTNQGGFYPEVITNSLDKLTIITQQLNEGLSRAAQLPITSSADAAALVADIERIATSADNLDTVANNITNVNTVATNITNVNSVGSNIANVNAVAANETNINAVKNNSTNINAVNSNKTNIDSVAGNSTNINSVASNSTNINSVAGNSTNINTVASNISSVNSAATNMSAIIAAPSQAAAAAASAAAAAASAASGMYSAVQDKSANYTVVAGDAGDLIRVTTTSGAITITLPLISGQVDGFKVAIVKWTNDGNAVSVVRSGSDTINGATSYSIATQYSSATFVADFETNQWYAVSGLSGATTGTGAIVLATAPTVSLPTIENIKMGYTTTATAAGTTTLTAASNYRQFFTGSTTQTIVLPVTSTLVTGIAYEIENNSTGLLTVNSSGGNLVGTIPAGVCAHVVCIGTTLTTAADWDWDYISTSTITGTGANVLGTSPTITNPLITEIRETATVSATAATGTINFDTLTQVVLYYTTNASGNFTVNFRGNSGSTLDSVMSTGQSLSTTFLVTNGSTAYYNSAVTIDGTSVTPKWQGGTAPTSGNASSIDSYTYVIIKTGSATFTVLATQTKFA